MKKFIFIILAVTMFYPQLMAVTNNVIDSLEVDECQPIDSALLAEAPIHFEQMLAQSANSRLAKNEGGQIWCEQNKVFISFISPKFKDMKNHYNSDLTDLGKLMILSFCGFLDNERENFDWFQFFALSSYLGYDIEFQIKENIEDDTPLLIPIPNKDIGFTF